MTQQREIVQVTGLRKRYRADGPDAVAGIDFAVREGEIFGLLGPNGAGKTTTIGVITTRVRPTAGEVTVDGHDVRREPVEIKRRIAVVPQLSNLDRSLTAIENLTFHAAYFGAGRRERRERAMELLERFGLAERANEQVGRYSGGMAQRLMIARALMHQPQVLFLDEPTTGLDPQSRLFLWETMLDLRERGTTLFLTTHDMVEADRLCDRIAVVDHGKIIALDTPRGLRTLLPAEAGIDVVLEGVRPQEAPFEALQGAEKVDVADAGEGRWRVRVYGGGERLAPGALAAAEANGHALVELRRLEGSLEDVFVHLTGREMR
jgi:ABC-2 type transport system ATP-binding protein